MSEHPSVLRLRAQVESLKHELERENDLRHHAERACDYWFRRSQKYGRHLDDCADPEVGICTCGFMDYSVMAVGSP